MPLLIDGTPLEGEGEILDDPDAFVKNYSHIFAPRAHKLCNYRTTVIRPEHPIVFIAPREIASTNARDFHTKALGTDRLTTNLAVILRCPQTGATSMGNFDGNALWLGITEMIEGLFRASLHPSIAGKWEANKHFDLHLVGGYEDDYDYSKYLSMEVLKEFHFRRGHFFTSMFFNLRTFCCLEVNSLGIPLREKIINRPILTSIAIDLPTGNLHSIWIPDDARIPVPVIRNGAYMFGPAIMRNVYNWRTNQFMVPSYNLTGRPDMRKWMTRSDGDILRTIKRSPDFESLVYVRHIREVINYIYHNPEPSVSIFLRRPEISFVKMSADHWHELFWPEVTMGIKWGKLWSKKN